MIMEPLCEAERRSLVGERSRRISPRGLFCFVCFSQDALMPIGRCGDRPPGYAGASGSFLSDWPVMQYRGSHSNQVKISFVGRYFLTRFIEPLSCDEALIQAGVFVMVA